MKNLRNLIILLVSTLCGALVGNTGFEDTFKQCIVGHKPQNDFKKCFGFGAISRLQVLDSNPQFDIIDGLTMSRDMSQEYREGAYNFADQDPSDFRSIIDTFDHVFSKRAMRWDMGFIHPGLAMRISPSVHPHGVLEFTMDQGQDTLSLHRVKEISTARLMAKQFLVPLLLGFKFNVATLVPIIFGILVLMAKKILYISKIALVVSAAIALGSLLFKGGGYSEGGESYSQSYPTDHYVATQYHPTSFGHHYKVHSEEYQPPEELQFRNVENNIGADQLKLFANLPEAFARSTDDSKQTTGRNFAWSEDENVKKL
ncbi:uncharacterized protein Osi10a [Euwallacea fornicatus]|uniref:uncharacterized protein Osi10a n=1 Tax=Euwallacea fornicatus TaxID=995702 RepID=UPI0033903F6A